MLSTNNGSGHFDPEYGISQPTFTRTCLLFFDRHDVIIICGQLWSLEQTYIKILSLFSLDFHALRCNASDIIMKNNFFKMY